MRPRTSLHPQFEVDASEAISFRWVEGTDKRYPPPSTIGDRHALACLSGWRDSHLDWWRTRCNPGTPVAVRSGSARFYDEATSPYLLLFKDRNGSAASGGSLCQDAVRYLLQFL